MQVLWSNKCTTSLISTNSNKKLEVTKDDYVEILNNLADEVLGDLKEKSLRKKYEQLITELVHQRDVVEMLIKNNVSNKDNFDWLYNMRFYLKIKEKNVLKQLELELANARFY